MGKGLDSNIVQGIVNKSKAVCAVVTPAQEQAVTAIDKEEMFRTRERRSHKLQALIPPSLHEELVAKAKEKGLSVAETLIRAMRIGLPQL